MKKYFEKSITIAALHGLSSGEFTFVRNDKSRNTLIISLPREERKDTTVSFTADILETVEYRESDMLDTGFYPVRLNGRIRFSFYHNEVIYVIASALSRKVRYGEMIDLDRGRFESEVLKHLNHEAAENRKLQKEVKALREELAGKAPESEKNKSSTVADILSSKPARGLKYVPPKDNDDDDDDLY